MKKEYLIFDAYIKTVSKEIKDRKVKRELKEELFSHLIEIYERNIALGMSDDDAQKDAVSHMGDSEAVAETFKKLYPISTNKFLKGLTSVLVYSFAHYFITIWSNGYISDVYGARIFLAFAVQFVVFYCLKRANKYFKAALITTVINYLCIFIFSILNKYFIIEFDIFLPILNFILGSIKYIFLFAGIINVEKDVEIPKGAALSSRISAVLMIVTHATLVASAYINSDFFIIILLVAFFTAIYPIIHIGSSYDLLDRIEWDIKKTVRDRRVATIIVIVFCLVAIGIRCIPLSAPELQNHNSVSINANKEAYEIRENLISLGLPKDIAYDLPDSEILLYKNAKSMEADIEDDEYVTLRNRAYAFYIFDDTKNLDYVRILICLDEFNNYDDFYRDGIYVYMPDKNEFDYFTHILCDVDEKTKSVIPVYSNLIDMNKAIGCEFTLPKDSENERLYISASVKAKTDINCFGLWCSYYHGEKSDSYRTFQAVQLRNERSSYVLYEETIRNGFDNPIYIEPETPTVFIPSLNDVTTTEEIEDFDNIDDLIEFWNP